VHQQAAPAEVHVPVGVVTFEQFPAGHDQASGEADTMAHPTESVAPPSTEAEHVPVHWPFTFAHAPLGQSTSAVQRQTLPTRAGGGWREVAHPVGAVPPSVIWLLTWMYP
jgi:hypothetical protein